MKLIFFAVVSTVLTAAASEQTSAHVLPSSIALPPMVFRLASTGAWSLAANTVTVADGKALTSLSNAMFSLSAKCANPFRTVKARHCKPNAWIAGLFTISDKAGVYALDPE
jgi:hypothetical protein